VFQQASLENRLLECGNPRARPFAINTVYITADTPEVVIVRE